MRTNSYLKVILNGGNVLIKASELKKETLGIIGLIIVTIFWGFGFPGMKIVG